MADISSSKDKMTDNEIDADSPITEALHEKYGGNVNWLIDETASLLSKINSNDSDISNLQSHTANTKGVKTFTGWEDEPTGLVATPPSGTTLVAALVHISANDGSGSGKAYVVISGAPASDGNFGGGSTDVNFLISNNELTATVDLTTNYDMHGLLLYTP